MSYPITAQYDPQHARGKVSAWAWILLAVAVLVLAGGAWSVYDRVLRTDSGIAMCQAWRDGDTTLGGEPKAAAPKLLEADYLKIRDMFENSRHDDIRKHGTKLIDLIWQVMQFGDNPGMEALAFIGPLTTEMTGLQSACADQGIVVTIAGR